MLDSVPVRLQERVYQTLDMQVGPAAMYCQWNPFCNCPNGMQTPDMMNQMFGTPARDPTLGDSGMGSVQTTLHQYMTPEPPKPFGLLDPQPFQYGFDLGEGHQVKFKGLDETTLTYGKVTYGKEIITELNGHECSMLDPILKNNFKKFP